MESIRIFVTGGTFDKEYNELTGELFFKDSHLPEMLKLGRCTCEVQVRTLMMIDSLHMTDDDRRRPAACRDAPREAHRGHPRHGHHGGDGRGAGARHRRTRPWS